MMQANTGVRFETKDSLLSQLVKQAEEKCRLNMKKSGWKPSPWAAQCMPAVILPPA